MAAAMAAAKPEARVAGSMLLLLLLLRTLHPQLRPTRWTKKRSRVLGQRLR